MSSDKEQQIIFADGLYFFEPSPNAPDFVLGTISIRPDVLVEWLERNKGLTTDAGFISCDVKRARATGKPYVSWRPPLEGKGRPF